MATGSIQSILRSIVVGACVSCLSAGVCLAGGKTCVRDGADTTEICLEWSQVPDPDEGNDFEVDFTDASNPDITLKSGDVGWILSSEDISSGNEGNIGDIRLNPAVSTDDFEVTIANGASAGADDVGSIDLSPASWTGYSTIEGGTISGDLNGVLTVAKGSGGSGGKCTLVIEGSVTGNITVPVVVSLVIEKNTSGVIDVGEVQASGLFQIGELISYPPQPGQGNVSGAVTVDYIRRNAAFETHGDLSANFTVVNGIQGGTLSIGGNVTSASTIKIEDMTTVLGTHSSALICWDNDPPYGEGALDFDGTLLLESGVRQNQNVWINAPLDAAASVDLKNQDVAGNLVVVRGGSGDVLNGGAVTATGYVSLTGGLEDFAGDATFSSVASGGEIHVTGGSDLNGSLIITGDMDGDIGLGVLVPDLGTSDVLGNGLIDIQGDCSGDIQVTGDVIGDGKIEVDGTLESTGRILIDGLLRGNIVIDEETQSLTLIRLTEGIDSGYAVTINESRGNFNANGTIHVGPVLYLGDTPPDLTFDGGIMIKDTTGGAGGDLEGTIKVVGCHNTGDLDICICGDNNGTVTIDQPNCTNQVTHSCVTGCP